jgi:TPR repeat protein
MTKSRFRILTSRANQGDPKAQYDLACLYGENDKEEAVKLFEKSARSGYPEARLTLGHFSKLGIGNPANLEEAAKWRRKAA